MEEGNRNNLATAEEKNPTMSPQTGGVCDCPPSGVVSGASGSGLSRTIERLNSDDAVRTVTTQT
jgi:hypothetical protein